MYKEDDQVIYSASDLVCFSRSPFASWMDRLRLEHPQLSPERDPSDSLMELLAEKGNDHELALLDSFKQQELSVVEIPTQFINFDEQHQITREAMQSGADVIFQAALELLPFRGFADFLVKVPNATGQSSSLGDYHYEVWDTKLAKSVKPYFVIHLCRNAGVRTGYSP